MPVKGQMNKTRIAKSTKKGPKLKWWYILPVIAIVAVAGYAIVRYSQAATTRPTSSTFYYTVGNGVKSYAGYQDKQSYGRGAKAPAFANVSGDATANTKKVCSRIVGTGPGTGELSIAIRNGGYGKVSTPFSIQGVSVVCVDTNQTLRGYPLEIRVKQTGGSTVYAVSMYGVK